MMISIDFMTLLPSASLPKWSLNGIYYYMGEYYFDSLFNLHDINVCQLLGDADPSSSYNSHMRVDLTLLKSQHLQ